MNVHTLFDVDSKEFCKNGSLLWDQTKVESVVHDLLGHWQTHWSVMYKVVHYYPRTHSRAHHDLVNVKTAAISTMLLVSILVFHSWKAAAIAK
jgi:hypothetical protein